MSSELRCLWEHAGGQLQDGWAIEPLESLLKDSKSIAVGVMYPGPDTPGGTPLIRVSDIRGGVISATPSYRISTETDHEYKRTRLIGDELLITLVGNPGECVVATSSMAGWNPARAIAVVRLKDSGLRTYVKAVLECSAGKHLIDSVLNTTVQRTLNLKDIRRLPIPLPSLGVIKEISETSEALTDRITLLRETKATLDAIAQALFKSWFVDFDPVRAKMEGRAPEGMGEDVAALFPNSFQSSDAGMGPTGWTVCKIEEVVRKVGMGPFGSNIKVSTFATEGVPVLNGRHLHSTLLADEDFSFITPEHADRLANSCVGAGDIVLTHRGSIGQVSLVPIGPRFNRYVVSQSQFFVRCDDELLPPEWMTYFFRSPSGQHSLLANASQVGVPAIAKPVTYVRSIRLIAPPPPIAKAFSTVVHALHGRMVACDSLVRTLGALRGVLLPRLISGQLRVPSAEALIEEALA